MSNLLKSKFLLGLLVAVAFVFTFTSTAEAAITKTLRMGMRDAQVVELQQALNAAGFTVSTTGAGSVGMETSYFGPKTAATVKSFQSAMNLAVDGIFGPISRAALATQGGGTYPAGCTSAEGYSTTTGNPCNTGGTTVTYPAGCTSAVGYSPTTGVKCDGVTTGGTTTGPVTVMLSAHTPASGTLVAAQATADLAHFTFNGEGTVTKVVLKRIGVSGDTTLSNVYLFDGANRLTDAASVSNGMVTFNVPAGIFTVNGLKTISVKSDILTGTQGQTVGVMLESFTTASGTTTANLSGNLHTVATATLASVSAGTVTPTGATINPAANVTLWQSTLSVNTRDVLLKRLSLRNVGSAPASAFQNFKLYVNGVEVGTAVGLDANGYVTFDLSSAPVTLTAGSRVVRVDADVVSGASRTVQLSLRQAADVDFVDSSFGVNIAPTSTPWAPASASTISGTSGGSLTIEKDVSSPSDNIVNAGSDVNLGTFKFTAYGEPIKVETLRATYASSDADIGSLRNGRILIGGVQYGSTATLNEDSQATPYTSYTVNYTFMPGTPVLVEIHADVYDNDGTDSITAGTDTLTAKFAVGSSNGVRQDSLGSFNAPATAVSANTLTVASTSITLSKNGTYTNQSTSFPATNYKIGSWNLAGSSVEDVLLTTLSLDVNEVVNATLDEDNITNLYPVIKDASGAVVAQPSPLATLSSGGQDSNFSINYTLKKNSTVTIEFYANLGGTTPTVSDSFKTVLKVSGTSLVSGTAVTSGDGSATVEGQTIAYAASTITVSKDASSPITGIVYADQTVTTLAAKFSAVTAGYNMTGLTLTFDATANTVVQNVMLYDGTTLIATAPMASTTTAVFSGLSWNIPANQSKVLTVKLALGKVGAGLGTTGSVITTTINAATDVVYTNTSTGVSTSSSTEEAGTATGSTMYVYKAIPTVNRVALPTTVLSSGTHVLAKFDVVSNGGTVAWKQVLLDISKSAAPTITSPTLWDVTNGANTQVTAAIVFQNDTNTDAACNASDTACELLISVGTNDDDNVEEQVSGTKTYEVRATIGGTLAAANAINTSIQSNLTHVSSAVYTSVDNDTTVDDASFVWSDQSAQSHDTGTADWVNEHLVRVLPTSTWTMTYPN